MHTRKDVTKIRLFIAEKETIANKIAEAIDGSFKKIKCCESYYLLSANDIIAFLQGHILEIPAPKKLNPDWEEWKLSSLPLRLKGYPLEIIPAKAKYFNVLKYILATHEIKVIVNAADFDREGQLVVDEVLNELRDELPGEVEIKRLIIKDTSVVGLKQSIASMPNNDDCSGMKLAALARSIVDWHIGYNYPRFFSLSARARGWDGLLLTPGRVKAPTNAFVVLRERAIQNFEKVQHYGFSGYFKPGVGLPIKAIWQKQEKTKGLNKDGLLTDIIETRALHEKMQPGKIATVNNVISEINDTTPPLPYSLSKLQLIADKKFGFSPAKTEQLCQLLYEKGYTSYPRTNCEYLPTEQRNEANVILKNLSLSGSETLRIVVNRSDLSILSECWNDSKITSHSAIIPTVTPCNVKALSEDERSIYTLIALNYIYQFMPSYKVETVTVLIDYNEEIFRAKKKNIVDIGWKIAEIEESKESDNNSSMKVNVGDELLMLQLFDTKDNTKPPERYTEGTLLWAMKNAHKYLQDKSLQKILAAADGIGREATRGAIIEELLERGYFVKQKKYLVPTKKSMQMFDFLPDYLNYPDYAAMLELQLNELEKTSNPALYNTIIRDAFNQISEICKSPISIPEKEPIICPKCKKGYLKLIRSKKSAFWACSTFNKDDPNSCRVTFNDADGEPILSADLNKNQGIKCPICKIGYLRYLDNIKMWGCSNHINGCNALFSGSSKEPVIIPCPKCKTGFLRKTKGSKGYFWGCTNYKIGCKSAYQDINDQPKI